MVTVHPICRLLRLARLRLFSNPHRYLHQCDLFSRRSDGLRRLHQYDRPAGAGFAQAESFAFGQRRPGDRARLRWCRGAFFGGIRHSGFPVEIGPETGWLDAGHRFNLYRQSAAHQHFVFHYRLLPRLVPIDPCLSGADLHGDRGLRLLRLVGVRFGEQGS